MVMVWASMDSSRLSLETPGRSARRTIPDLSSTTSTAGMRTASSRACALLVSVMAVSSLDGDAPRLRGLVAPHAHVQHAVAVVGSDAVGIDVVRQGDDAPEAAREALVDMQGIDAGRERVDLHRLGRAAHVDGGKPAAGEAPDVGRHVESLRQLALQAVKLREDVAGIVHAIHRRGLHGWRADRARSTS